IGRGEKFRVHALACWQPEGWTLNISGCPHLSWFDLVKHIPRDEDGEESIKERAEDERHRSPYRRAEFTGQQPSGDEGNLHAGDRQHKTRKVPQEDRKSTRLNSS